MQERVSGVALLLWASSSEESSASLLSTQRETRSSSLTHAIALCLTAGDLPRRSCDVGVFAHLSTSPERGRRVGAGLCSPSSRGLKISITGAEPSLHVDEYLQERAAAPEALQYPQSRLPRLSPKATLLKSGLQRRPAAGQRGMAAGVCCCARAWTRSLCGSQQPHSNRARLARWGGACSISDMEDT
eukprot:3019007-Pleurochrysis_carterae.AAC.3